MARRLLISYLGLIAVTVVLFAFLINIVTTQTFSRYLGDQASAHSTMLPVMLAGYHTRNGTWDGVQPEIDQASILIGAEVVLADREGRIVAATQRDLIGSVADGNPALGQPIPVVGSGSRTMGTIYVGRNDAMQRADAAFLAGVTQALVVAGVVVALLATGLGLLLARSISRPLTGMGRAAAHLARGDYAVRVPPGGKDEVGALATAFNRMAEGMAGVERLRRELVANVSHDLRTPLTVLRGYLEGLRSGEIADRRSAEIAFEAMDAEVVRLLRLLDDLRPLADLDAGAAPLERRPAAAADLVREVLDRVAPLAATKGIRLSNEVPPHLPPVNVDPERLGQALFNLLENAVRHTPHAGTITLGAGRAEYPNGGQEHFWLAVRDTGEGIARKHLPHVFERFYRVDPARSRADGGAGLGLAIVRAIVEAHGGVVTAESDGVAGHGSTFTIYLPL